MYHTVLNLPKQLHSVSARFFTNYIFPCLLFVIIYVKSFLLFQIKRQSENYSPVLRANSIVILQKTHILNDAGDECFGHSTEHCIQEEQVYLFRLKMKDVFFLFYLEKFYVRTVSVDPATIMYSAHCRGLILHLMTHKNTPHSVGLLWTRDQSETGTST